MRSNSAKREAIEAIERLPDDVPFDVIVYRLYVLGKVQQGLQDIECGRLISSEELVRDIEQW